MWKSYVGLKFVFKYVFLRKDFHQTTRNTRHSEVLKIQRGTLLVPKDRKNWMGYGDRNSLLKKFVKRLENHTTEFQQKRKERIGQVQLLLLYKCGI